MLSLWLFPDSLQASSSYQTGCTHKTANDTSSCLSATWLFPIDQSFIDEDAPFISPPRHLAPGSFQDLVPGSDCPDRETKWVLFLIPKPHWGTLQGGCRVLGFGPQEQHTSSCSCWELAQMGVWRNV